MTGRLRFSALSVLTHARQAMCISLITTSRLKPGTVIILQPETAKKCYLKNGKILSPLNLTRGSFLFCLCWEDKLFVILYDTNCEVA